MATGLNLKARGREFGADTRAGGRWRRSGTGGVGFWAAVGCATWGSGRGFGYNRRGIFFGDREAELGGSVGDLVAAEAHGGRRGEGRRSPGVAGGAGGLAGSRGRVWTRRGSGSSLCEEGKKI